MRVYCELKDIKKDNENNLAEGQYLYIYTEKIPSLVIIPFTEFKSFYKQSSRDFKPLILELGVSLDNQNIVNFEKNEPDFKGAVNYLAKKISVSDSDFKDGDELIIESSFGTFLELPWEEITQNKVIVYRKVVANKKSNPDELSNNFLFIISYSDASNNGNRGSITEGLKKEVKAIISHILEAAPKNFKINNTSISKHTTKESFQSLPLNNYNCIHVVMHGDESGGLCLENPDMDKYKTEDIISVDEVIKEFSNKNFLLLFFSFCYSGGGVNNEGNSLAFQTADQGISKYVIGYKYGVGENSAINFAEIFYEKLFCIISDNKSNRFEEAYKQAVLKYLENQKIGESKYTPILYVNT